MKEYNPDFYEEEYLNGSNSNYGESYFTEEKIDEMKKFVYRLNDTFNPFTVLEIGCAYGYNIKFFNELGVEAHGVDISNYAIKNRKHKNCIRLDVMNEPLPFADKYFDLVIIQDVLEHLPEESLNFVLSEVSRVSKRFLYLGIPTVVYPGLQDLEKYDTEPSHINVPVLSHIIFRFEDVGFVLDSAQRTSFWDYRMVFSKKEEDEIVINQLEYNLKLKERRNKKKNECINC